MIEKVTILMATYNGGDFLHDQIDSVMAQSYINWELIIRDDGSADATLNILRQYTATDSRINVIEYGDVYGSACSNFAQLLQWAVENKRQYIMFADQDDIWLADKIEVSLRELLEQEERLGADYPLAAYGKFSYLDVQNNLINKSFNFQKNTTLNNLLCSNTVYGCTMIINYALAKLSSPIPVQAVNHDYWIAMVACSLGKITFIDRVLLKYRQHSNNSSGSIEKTSFKSRFKRYLVNKNVLYPEISKNILMYKAFLKTYKVHLRVNHIKLLNGYFYNLKSSNFGLITFLIKNKVLKTDKPRSILYLYTMMRLRSSFIERSQQ